MTTKVNGDVAHSNQDMIFLQKRSTSVAKSKIEEEIYKKLDVKKLASASSNVIRVADLGCATGPNTFTTTHDMIEAIKNKYTSQCHHPNNNTTVMPEFHVSFNDLPSNDFNTLLASLPQDREYFAAGVPGSFYGRLFPESSLHFAYANYALHFLSKSPEEVQDVDSPAWNKGRIHYTSSSKEVVDAYATQFAKDLGNFLGARATELALGGMLVMVMQGVPNGMPHSHIINGMLYDSMGYILTELSKEVTTCFSPCIISFLVLLHCNWKQKYFCYLPYLKQVAIYLSPFFLQ